VTRAGDTSTPTLSLKLPAKPASVRAARHATEAYARAHGADAGAVEIAVSEVVSNAVLHGRRDGVGGNVSVDAWCGDGELVVVVSDDGAGISPKPNSPGLGYGLPLVARLSEEMGIETGPVGGTRIRMRFAAAG
jgi:serine/threonine-protein kinase RsbW/stage II sporulation protein AB (anti-sigma F factor)